MLGYDVPGRSPVDISLTNAKNIPEQIFIRLFGLDKKYKKSGVWYLLALYLEFGTCWFCTFASLLL